MEFLKNIFGGFGKSKASSSSDKRNPTGYEVASYGGFDLSTGDKSKYINAMRSWTFACVSAIADEVATIQIKLYENKKSDNIEEVLEHPSLDTLYKVNNFTTKFDHFWLTQTYLELAGEAPWFIEKIDGVPSAIYFLKPDRITPIPDKDKVIAGYKYKLPDGTDQMLNVDDVIFLKFPNPANPFRGKGTLEYAARTVDIDDESEKWNWLFFKNEARPDTVISVEDWENSTPEQIERLKKSLEKEHRGSDKSHKTMVLFGGLKIDTVGWTPKDMDFTEQLRYGRDKILAMFRVPKAIVSQTEGVNFASAKTAQYIFARWTINPKMERLIQQLNEFYLPMFEGTENMFFGFVSPIPEDEEAKLKKYDNALKNGWMTINEVRDIEGLDNIPGLDNPYMPLNLVQVGEGAEVDEPYEVPPEPPKKPEKPDDEEEEEEPKKKKITQEQRNHLRARSGKYIDLNKKLVKVKNNVKEKIREELKNNAKKAKKIITKKDEKVKTLAEVIKKSLVNNIKKSKAQKDAKK